MNRADPKAQERFGGYGRLLRNAVFVVGTSVATYYGAYKQLFPDAQPAAHPAAVRSAVPAAESPLPPSLQRIAITHRVILDSGRVPEAIQQTSSPAGDADSRLGATGSRAPGHGVDVPHGPPSARMEAQPDPEGAQPRVATAADQAITPGHTNSKSPVSRSEEAAANGALPEIASSPFDANMAVSIWASDPYPLGLAVDLAQSLTRSNYIGIYPEGSDPHRDGPTVTANAGYRGTVGLLLEAGHRPNYVVSTHPENVPDFSMEVMVHLDDVSLEPGGGVILLALCTTRESGAPEVLAGLRISSLGGQLFIHLDTFQARDGRLEPGPRLTVNPGWNRLGLRWIQGQVSQFGDRAILAINREVVDDWRGVSDYTRGGVETVLLGAVSNLGTTQGAFAVDDYTSFRSPGPPLAYLAPSDQLGTRDSRAQ